ncbi:unnamed protein product, partial [Mycena citricolor]
GRLLSVFFLLLLPLPGPRRFCSERKWQMFPRDSQFPQIGFLPSHFNFRSETKSCMLPRSSSGSLLAWDHRLRRDIGEGSLLGHRTTLMPLAKADVVAASTEDLGAGIPGRGGVSRMML